MTMIRNRSELAISRRALVRAAGALGASALCGAGFWSAPASAAGARDPRLVVVILRGAVDGLSAIPPVGDPDYAALHGDLAFAASGERAALPLDGFFAAHPSLVAFRRMYDQKHAAVVHAVATGYRDRSHFDGQDVLESGNPKPGRTESGWLNRTLGALPASASRRALGVGATAPLIIRGPAPALGWAPPGGVGPANSDLTERVLDLYAHRDPPLGQQLSAALAAEKVASESSSGDPARKPHYGGAVEQMRLAAEGALRRPTGRGSRRWPSTVSTPIRTRARRKACSPSASRGSTPPSTLSRPTSATPGRTRSSSRSPNSAAPFASTAPTAPTMARRRPRSLPAARSPAAG
jgi:uncharacterized protein (DUF1501 family)